MLMPLLKLDHVTKKFGGLIAVNDVSISIQPQEVAFLVGPNGAGKTTVFNLIAGMMHPDQGKIVFESKDISQMSADRATKLGIGRTFQLVKPLRNLTVLENVMLGAFLHTSSTVVASREATQILKFLQMEDVANLPALGLPQAKLKRLEIARALATKPRLILLDEVVAGLSTSEALVLADLLARLREWGISAVGGVEHVMPVVMRIADRVLVLDHGTLIAEGTPEEVVHMPRVIEAYLGPKYKEFIQ
jgi:branched-chain amino acid transport system ATP-binding protein